MSESDHARLTGYGRVSRTEGPLPAAAHLDGPQGRVQPGEQALRLVAALRAVVPQDYEEDDPHTADAAKLRAVHALLYARD
jgi:hypothetical protein